MRAGGIKPNVSTLGAEQVEFYSAIGTGKSLSSKTKDKASKNSKEVLQISNTSKHDYKSICESESESEINVTITGDCGGITMTNDENNDEYKSEMMQQQKERFFNWFFFSIAIGSMVAYSVIAYLCQNVGFDIGYLVPTISLMIAIIIFVSFSKYYKVTPVRKFQTSVTSEKRNKCGCGDSMVFLFCQIVWHGLFDDNTNGNYNRTVSSMNGNIEDVDVDVCDDDHVDSCKVHWLDKCKISLNGKFSDCDVESTKQVLNLVIYYVYFIFLCSAWFQEFNLLYAQGCQMVCNILVFCMYDHNI